MMALAVAVMAAVMAVAVGSETRLPDVEFASLDCPTVGVVGKPVRVPFTIHSSLPTERAVVVDFRTSSGDAIRKEVRLPAMGTATAQDNPAAARAAAATSKAEAIVLPFTVDKTGALQ